MGKSFCNYLLSINCFLTFILYSFQFADVAKTQQTSMTETPQFFMESNQEKVAGSKLSSNTASVLQRKFMHPGMHSCSSGQFLELPELHSTLRSVRSTLPLERKSKRVKKKMIERKASPQKNKEHEKDNYTMDECEHTDGTASLISSSSTTVPSRNTSALMGIQEEELKIQNLQLDMGTRTNSLATTSAASSCNNLHESAQLTDSNNTSEGSRRYTKVQQNKSSLTLVNGKKRNSPKNDLIWDELHHKNAGSLFFSTYMPSYGTSLN